MTNMKRLIVILALGIGVSRPASGQQAWSGILSDSHCAESHQSAAAAGSLTDRQCVFECLKALEKYVLVDQKGVVLQIVNQDFPGFPLYVGRPVQLRGELKDGAVMVSRVEPVAAHLHLGHVMTNWRDTPRNVGLLIAAVTDGETAAVHARLAAQAQDLAAMKVHAGHVLQALDPSLEKSGPASGYGVKVASAGALQHLQLAANADGATPNIRTHATHAGAALADVAKWTDEAIVKIAEIRAASSAEAAAPLVRALYELTVAISEGADTNKDGTVGWESGEGGLRQAQAHMLLMMKGEGLQNASR
jgi:hypothetical protein